jgi:hypothetical protein
MSGAPRAATGRKPDPSFRTVATATAIIIIRSRAWWAEEASRCGSDWRGIVESHLAVLAKLGVIERGARQ